MLLEWDGNIPDFAVYHAELLKAQQYMSATFRGAADPVATDGPEQVANPLHVLVPELLS